MFEEMSSSPGANLPSPPLLLILLILEGPIIENVSTILLNYRQVLVAKIAICIFYVKNVFFKIRDSILAENDLNVLEFFTKIQKDLVNNVL